MEEFMLVDVEGYEFENLDIKISIFGQSRTGSKTI